MSSKTKIVVLKLKEMIYTVVFVVLGIILILLLVLLITRKAAKEETDIPKSTFSPGVYTSSIVLATNPVDIEVIVDCEQIKSIQLINTSESVETMYPLITDSLHSIASQVIKNNSTQNITYNQEAKYTSIVLIQAIQSALDKAYND
ncbi:MAG: hypothetical protein ACI4EN_02205 [Butyrivibrio sp.]